MIEWIFSWIYVSTEKWMFIVYLMTIILMILVTIYLVRSELRKNNVDK